MVVPTEIGGMSKDLSHPSGRAVAPMATITAALKWPHAYSCKRPSVPLEHLHLAYQHRRRPPREEQQLRHASATARRVRTTAGRHEKSRVHRRRRFCSRKAGYGALPVRSPSPLLRIRTRGLVRDRHSPQFLNWMAPTPLLPSSRVIQSGSDHPSSRDWF